MRIDCIESAADLADSWRSIELENPALSVFQSWLWNSAWLRTVMPHLKRSGLRCYLASADSGKAIAIVPCFRRSFMGGTVKVTQLLGTRMSFLNDIVCVCPDDLELAGEILSKLTQALQPSEIMHLKHLNRSSAFTRTLIERELAEVQCRRLFVTYAGGEPDPLARLSRRHRKGMRWQERKLRETFGAYYEVAPVDSAAAAFDRFAGLHASRFRQRGAETLLQGANLDFLRSAFIALCRQGKAEIIELRTAERPIAALLGVVDHPRYCFVNGGFDPELAQFSPLKLLTANAMRHAFADLGCLQFELGPDYEAYKQAWKPQAERSFSACLARAALPSRLLASGYRLAFRRAVRSSTGDIR